MKEGVLEHVSIVVDSQVSRIVQPKNGDPTDTERTRQVYLEAKQLATELNKPVVVLFHSGLRVQVNPNKQKS